MKMTLGEGGEKTMVRTGQGPPFEGKMADGIRAS